MRGDGEPAKKEILRLLSPTAKPKRKVAAFFRLTLRPRRLKLIQVEGRGANAEALLDSGAVSNLLSSSLWYKISLKASPTSKKITPANGDPSLYVGSLLDVPVSFAEINIAEDFLVINGPSFHIIVQALALEALQACLDMGKQQVIISVKD